MANPTVDAIAGGPQTPRTVARRAHRQQGLTLLESALLISLAGVVIASLVPAWIRIPSVLFYYLGYKF